MLHWFEHDIIDRGRLALFCCLIAFILTFFVTRTFVRLIRHRAAIGRPARWWEPRNIHIGTKHIHHVVVGVLLVMISGVTLVTLSTSGTEVEFTGAAIVFGIGGALVLDEYALILHLSDVYWEEDGRTSVDAVFAAVAVGGLLVLGLHPLMFFISLWQDTTHSFVLRAGVVFAMALTLPDASVLTAAAFACTVTCEDTATIFKRRSRLRIPVSSLIVAGCAVASPGADAIRE